MFSPRALPRVLAVCAIRGAVVSIVAASIGCGSSSPTSPSTPPLVSVGFASNGALMSLLIGPGDRTQAVALAAASPTATVENVTNAARWESSNPAVMTVAAGGLITAVAPGDAEIRAVYQTVTAQAHVTVFSPERVRGLQISGRTDCWPTQSDLPWEVYATLDTGEYFRVEHPAWRAGNAAVAAVSDAGILTCGTTGTTVIEVTYQSRTAAQSVTVKVPIDTVEIVGGSSRGGFPAGQPTTEEVYGYYVLASAASGRVVQLIVNQDGVSLVPDASSLAVRLGNGPVRLTTTFVVPAGTTYYCSTFALQVAGSSKLIRDPRDTCFNH